MENCLTWLRVESPSENCGIERARLRRWPQEITIFLTRGADACVKWQRSLEHIQDLYRAKSHDTAKGKWTQSPPLTKKLLTSDSCWKRENTFSPKDYHLLYQRHSMPGPAHAQEQLQSTKRTAGIFVCLFCLSIFFLPFFCHIWLFCCCFFSFLVWAFCFDILGMERERR